MSASRGIVGIDLGGTHLRAASTSVAGTEITRRLPAVPAPTSLDAFHAAVRDAAVALLGDGVASVGIALPGLVEGTTARWVPNLAYLDGVDVADVLSAVSPQIVVLNDAHAALLAESTIGAAARTDTALLLAIGTGIGSAVLAGGQLVRGAGGGACSFGWACADVDDAGDERHGWLERHASGSALDTLAAHWGGDSGSALVTAARAGDQRAVDLVRSSARALGTTLAAAIGLLDPAVVVISGGVADALDVLLDEIRVTLHRQLPAHLQEVPVVAGHLGAEAGLQGALVAARRGERWWEAP